MTKTELGCEAIRAPLEQAASAAAGPKGLEILACALVDIREDEVVVTCSDLERQIVARQQSMTAAAMKFCTPARRLLDMLKLMPGDAGLSLSLGPELMTVKHASGSMRLPLREPADFPAFELDAEPLELRVSAGDLKGVLRQVLPAAADKDVRYYLNGVCFDVLPDALTLVASNGHRMHKSSLAVGGGQSGEFIMPRNAATDLARHLPDSNSEVCLRFGPTTMSVQVWSTRFSTRLIAGKFAPWRRIFVDDGAVTVKVEREALLATINRIKLFAEGDMQAMSLEVGHGVLRLQASGTNGAVAEEELPADTVGTTLLGFSVPYVIDAVTACEADMILMRFCASVVGQGGFFADADGDEQFGAYVCQLRI